MIKETLFVAGIVLAVAGLQFLLVWLGHPNAVWLWCTVLGLC